MRNADEGGSRGLVLGASEGEVLGSGTQGGELACGVDEQHLSSELADGFGEVPEGPALPGASGSHDGNVPTEESFEGYLNGHGLVHREVPKKKSVLAQVGGPEHCTHSFAAGREYRVADPWIDTDPTSGGPVETER